MKKFYLLGKNILFPICRSLTGNGNRKTLFKIKNLFPDLRIKKVKSGTKAFDWKIPPEWNVTDAFILDKFNKKIIDFKENNLSLLGYSEKKFSYIKKKDLLKKIFFLKKIPNAIPYVASYYKRRWGFSTSYKQVRMIKSKYNNNDFFNVVIKSNKNKNGYLNYGELVIKGKSQKEILISTYICHPSMANDNLSGIIISMALINYYKRKKLKKTLRFIFIPETIGSIYYISKNLKRLRKNLLGGYNLTCLGDEREYSLMFSKYKDKPSDEAIIEAYKILRIKKYRIHSFLKRGSDERQFNSPGIDLPITSVFRSKYGEYKEYHTSLDNFNLVTLKGLKESFKVVKTAINILLNNIYPKTKILCEPQMGKRGLYPTLSTTKNKGIVDSYMDFLQYSDGKNSLKKISKLIGLNNSKTNQIYRLLLKENLIFKN